MHSPPELVIVGLTLRVLPSDGSSYLGGPVPGAAAGAVALGLAPSCRTAAGMDLDGEEEETLLRLCGEAGLRRLPMPHPRFAAPILMHGAPQRARFDDVRRFSYPTDPLPGSAPLVLANADPAWHSELLRRSGGSGRPILTDCYADWLTIRQRPMADCLAASTIVTATEAELRAMPDVCRQAIAWMLGQGGILVRKQGPMGIVLESAAGRQAMAAPAVGRPVTDIGAGDVLAGALAAALLAPRPGLRDLARAYRNARPAIARLLSGERPWKITARP